jgi:hypothetical protein
MTMLVSLDNTAAPINADVATIQGRALDSTYRTAQYSTRVMQRVISPSSRTCRLTITW